MAKVWKVDFYPQDWLIATTSMNPAQRGVYVQIVALIFAHGGPIPHDPSWIASMSGCSTRMAEKIIKELAEIPKIQIADGKISQRRAMLEVNAKIKRLEKPSKVSRESVDNASEVRRERVDNASGTGRKPHEKERDVNEINDITDRPVTSKPPPPHPHPTTSPTPTLDTSVSNLSSTEANMYFSALWEAYPGRGKYGLCGAGFKGSRKKAFEKFVVLLKKENNHEAFTRELIQSAYLYTGHLDRAQCPSKHLITWLNQECWADDYSSGGETGGTGLDAIAEGFGNAVRKNGPV